jgi:hypothetical protein
MNAFPGCGTIILSLLLFLMYAWVCLLCITSNAFLISWKMRKKKDEKIMGRGEENRKGIWKWSLCNSTSWQFSMSLLPEKKKSVSVSISFSFFFKWTNALGIWQTNQTRSGQNRRFTHPYKMLSGDHVRNKGVGSRAGRAPRVLTVTF